MGVFILIGRGIRARTILVTGLSAISERPFGRVTKGAYKDGQLGTGAHIVTRHLNPSERRAYYYAKSNGLKVIELEEVPSSYPTIPPAEAVVRRGVNPRLRIIPTPTIAFRGYP